MKNKSILFLFTCFALTQNEVCFEIEPNPDLSSPAFSCFTKYINVLDCFKVYAESTVPDNKLLHVAAVAAELLDNDENGIVDDPDIFNALQSAEALMPIFTYDGNACMNNFADHYNGDGVSAVLFRNEIDPTQPGHWGDDATVEEVVHTINHVGHVTVYPDIFGLAPNSSQMSNAMDIARGGQFINVPQVYPEEAWYHYYDWTCDYECQAIEYLYWCIVSNMGILDDIATCSGIANEWEPCSPELFQSTDNAMYDIITNPEYLIPQLAPDGNYCPITSILGDVNSDGEINILDVVLTVNIILSTEYNEIADLNSDGNVDVLDIVIIINIILIS